MNTKHIAIFFRAFSLLELLVGLIVISVALAAFAPVATRNVQKQKTAISTKLTENCTRFGFDNYCKLCYGKEKCAVCTKGCAEGINLNPEKCICGN